MIRSFYIWLDFWGVVFFVYYDGVIESWRIKITFGFGGGYCFSFDDMKYYRLYMFRVGSYMVLWKEVLVLGEKKFFFSSRRVSCFGTGIVFGRFIEEMGGCFEY